MITKRQKQALEFIKSYSKKHGFAPSLEEIKTHLKLSSVSTAHHHVKKLEELGLIYKEENQPRAVAAKDEVKSIEIPIVGTIAAGLPIEAIEIPDETISLSQGELPLNGKHYALRVSGDSMINEGIFNGDIVIVHQQQTADNGQTVVAVIDDNQATLKKIYKEKNKFRLQPANPTFAPIFRNSVDIRGVVVKIIRNIEPLKNDGGFIMQIKQMPFTTNAQRIATSDPDAKAKPFLQWVGGKREMIEQYKEFIPKKFNRYYEPFLGGAAMFYYLLPQDAFLADNNAELIRTYEGVRDNPEEVISILKELKSRHSKELYMLVRNLDRQPGFFQKTNNAEIAARMIYLNQTCFNGIYRVNQKSQFNVPIGSSLNRLICDESTIRNASKALKKVTVKDADFASVTKEAKRGDFIYFDPPYFPVSVYSDFTRYTKEKFYKEDQIKLKNEIDRLGKIGCKVMLSNSDCEFIRDLYKDYKIHKVYSSRSLNCKIDRRGKVSELLITNY